MCFILIAYNIHPQYHVIIAANRDEFFDRPTQTLDYWKDAPDVIGGRDLKEGGTWLGMTRSGRLAALTNYREPQTFAAGKITRGFLVSDFLKINLSPQIYLSDVQKKGSDYNGFNLLAGTPGDLWYYSNRGHRIKRLEPGLYGISNHLLDTPWPKVSRGKTRLAGLLSENPPLQVEAIFEILSDRSRPDDKNLPETGVGLEWERILSPIFVESTIYGTRCSSVILIERSGRAVFYERSFDSGAAAPEKFETKKIDLSF